MPRRSLPMPFLAVLFTIAAGPSFAGCGAPSGHPAPGSEEQWAAYGRDPAGTRSSPLDQINTGNVADLEVAWTYRTGDATHEDASEGATEGCGRCHTGSSKFEATPILAAGRLVLSTPLNRLIALDPATGRELWRHDPQIRMDLERNEGFVSRGVAYWEDRRQPDTPCGRRILFGTIDARLLALDAASGRPCAGFGSAGTVRLDEGVGPVQEGQYGVTSPPAVVNDVVVVGSSMGDNRRVDMERGVVRGFDARTGRLLWSWDPIPRSEDDPAYREWTAEAASRTGGANAWPPLSADPERDLVFIPTGSAAPDFYGGERPGDNRYANSVVALRATTGKLVWSFQVVHHDLWDFDIPAQPTLANVPRDGREVPAVIVTTKMGFIYLLDRETGTPLFPVEERPVPVSTVPGEAASATQPFPALPRPLHPTTLREEELWGPTPADREACVTMFRGLRNEGIFTPPSLEGTLFFPGFAGAMNWGGLAVDQGSSTAIVNTLRIAMWVRLHPRPPGFAGGNQQGTPYTMTRGMLVSPSGAICNAPPWGTLVAIDLATGEVKWEVPFGIIPALAANPEAAKWGAPSMGGPIVTAGGLVFIGAAQDDAIRAFDLASGVELWKAGLPAGGQATPMTYQVNGRQYLVIAAGGHGNAGTTFGDYVVAYALPDRASPDP